MDRDSIGGNFPTLGVMIFVVVLVLHRGQGVQGIVLAAIGRRLA